MRRFVEYRRWIWRNFLLLNSAVVLRVIGGFVTVTGLHADWIDPAANWACWVVPLTIFELSQCQQRLKKLAV